MGACNLNHFHEDVRKKLENQRNALPAAIAEGMDQFLQREHEQAVLNEVFHLLKKYDLASEGEREVRNSKLRAWIE